MMTPRAAASPPPPPPPPAGGCGCCACRTEAARQQLTGRRQWYDKLYARLISGSAAQYNELLGERKRALLRPVLAAAAAAPSSAPLDLLEVGIGGGANLGFLAPAQERLRVTGVDPNAEMWPYLRAAADAAGFDAGRLSLVRGVAEELPVDDASQDVVLATLVLCSVADQRAALAEVLRVLRPGGRFVFLEHVAAPLGSSTRTLQQLVNPLWRRVADGCQVTRETWLRIEGAGFSDVQLERFLASPSPMLALIAPHIGGWAIK